MNRLSTNLANVNVIDADGHVRGRDGDVKKFIAEPHCQRQGGLLPSDVWDSSMYGKLGLRVSDVATRLSDMDKEGIDISVLFPTSSFGVTQLRERDYAAAYCHGYMASTIRGRSDISDSHKRKVLRDNAVRPYGWDR